jgi:hypothetical protein
MTAAIAATQRLPRIVKVSVMPAPVDRVLSEETDALTDRRH